MVAYRIDLDCSLRGRGPTALGVFALRPQSLTGSMVSSQIPAQIFRLRCRSPGVMAGGDEPPQHVFFVHTWDILEKVRRCRTVIAKETVGTAGSCKCVNCVNTDSPSAVKSSDLRKKMCSLGARRTRASLCSAVFAMISLSWAGHSFDLNPHLVGHVVVEYVAVRRISVAFVLCFTQVPEKSEGSSLPWFRL